MGGKQATPTLDEPIGDETCWKGDIILEQENTSSPSALRSTASPAYHSRVYLAAQTIPDSFGPLARRLSLLSLQSAAESTRERSPVGLLLFLESRGLPLEAKEGTRQDEMRENPLFHPTRSHT